MVGSHEEPKDIHRGSERRRVLESARCWEFGSVAYWSVAARRACALEGAAACFDVGYDHAAVLIVGHRF